MAKILTLFPKTNYDLEWLNTLNLIEKSDNKREKYLNLLERLFLLDKKMGLRPKTKDWMFLHNRIRDIKRRLA